MGGHKSQKQRKREQAGRTPLQGSLANRNHSSQTTTETVMGEDMLSSVEIKEGATSKRGVEHQIATTPGASLPRYAQ